jgi:hypothetical protein
MQINSTVNHQEANENKHTIHQTIEYSESFFTGKGIIAINTYIKTKGHLKLTIELLLKELQK